MSKFPLIKEPSLVQANMRVRTLSEDLDPRSTALESSLILVILARILAQGHIPLKYI